MTVPTPPSDNPTAGDPPGREPADHSGSIRHPARLTALQRLALLDTPAEQAFDRLTRLAAKILHAPVALLSLVDGDRSFFKSSVGLPAPWASRRETLLSHSVCQHVVATKAPLVVNDARAHPLLSDNQAVAELRIVAYLGIPLVTAEGHALGTFAVIDTVPREWASEDVTTLGDLAASAMTEIELRAETNERLLVEQRLQLLESVVGNASAAVLIAEANPAEPSDPRIVFVNDAYSRLTGYSLVEVVGRTHQILNSSETDRSQVDTIRTALASWKPTRLNVLSHRKDGSTFWAELNIVPIADKAGRYSHWVVIERDISEQKATEAALRESETRFHNVIIALPAAMYSTDREGRITFFNEPAAELWGCRPIIGKDLWCGSWRLFRPDGSPLPHDQCPMAIALREGRSVRGQEIIVERPDGTRAWVLAYPEPMRDGSGEIVGAVNMLVDITGRKQAEEALRRSAVELRRLALIAERTDNAVILTDPQGRIEWVNNGFSRITEFTLADVLGKTPGSVLQGPDTDPATVAHMRERLRQGQGFQVEILNYTKSGRTYWLAIEVQPLRDDQGNVTQFMAIESDITLYKWSQTVLKEANHELEVRVAQRTAELSKANEFLKALLDNIQDSIVACDSESVLTLFNRSTREVHGLQEQPIHPDQWANHYGLYRADGQTPMTTDEIPLTRALRGERLRNVEMVIISKGGEARTLLASGQAFYDDQGNKLGAVVSMHDITERKWAESELLKAHAELERRVETRTAELAQAKEAAEAANRAKSEFFSRMSHELRTPLNAILGFGQLLEMDALSAPQHESAEQIVKGGRHLLALVNEVLDIARIEAGGAGVVSPEDVDLGELVGEVLGMIQPLADKAHVRLLLPQPGLCDGAVRADLQRLKQILLNLLSNAVKYNQEGGAVVVSCEETAGEMLRIKVTDTGVGIPPEKMHRLFAPFDRLEAEQKEIEGSGLGLTLSKGLAESMQGVMGVESTVGKGSTFWVELPRIAKTKTPARAEPAAVPAPVDMPDRFGTVLCIEDNPGNIRLLEHIMHLRSGVRLLTAIQGRLGLDLAREHRPDLIFLDLHLPDIKGDEVLRRLRDDDATRDLPVVILSADASPGQVKRLLAAGANRYLTKPFSIKDFLQIVDEALHRPER